METLQRIQETTLSDNGLYEVIKVERTAELDPEIVQLKEELDTERERGLRMLAEFDNYRRRTRQERARAEQAGKHEVLLALLDVMDDFDRALLHVGGAPDAVILDALCQFAPYVLKSVHGPGCHKPPNETRCQTLPQIATIASICSPLVLHDLLPC